MTRKANPKLGVLGPCGFLDLLRHGRCFPFVFFLSFGFWGFFYEGKMSGIFMDERFRENALL
jgi:hypothetical protein